MLSKPQAGSVTEDALWQLARAAISCVPACATLPAPLPSPHSPCRPSQPQAAMPPVWGMSDPLPLHLPASSAAAEPCTPEAEPKAVSGGQPKSSGANALPAAGLRAAAAYDECHLLTLPFAGLPCSARPGCGCSGAEGCGEQRHDRSCLLGNQRLCLLLWPAGVQVCRELAGA